MKLRPAFFVHPALLLAILLAASPARGAVVLLGGEDGTEDPPAPSEGATTEEDWNPTVTCSVAAGQGIVDLLTCLEDEITNPPPACQSQVEITSRPGSGLVIPQQNLPDDCYDYSPYAREDFDVWVLLPPPDRWGIEIRRLDGSEIHHISLRENDPGIQTTELQMDAPKLVAVVGQVVEEPAGDGLVQLTVNDVRIPVLTAQFPSSVEINAEIVRALRAAGFDVGVRTGTMVVAASKFDPAGGVQRVQFRCTDSAITRSDLTLIPAEDPDM